MFKWINIHKEDNTAFIIFIRFLYIIGKSTIINTIIITLLGIIIPLLFDHGQYIWSIITGVLLILYIVFHSICARYEKHEYKRREFAIKVLDNQSSLINTLNIEVKSNPRWKNTVFKKISEIVCEKIQRVFRDVLKCSTRISIEYVFDKNIKNKTETYVKMSGRRSPNRDICRNSTSLDNRRKYYSYRIFTDNKIGIHTISKDEIDKGLNWYKNPTHTNDVKQYIGIAVSVLDDEHVNFILQIDCLDDIHFGKNNSEKDIKLFINQYLKSYINIVSLSYLLNLNKYTKIPEV